MKALVTGGAGFIGSHLADYLVDQGIDVVVVDNLSMGKITNLKHRQKMTIYVEDVCNKIFMQKLLQEEKFDYIYFLAAVASVADSIERPFETHKINSTAVLDLLEYIRKTHLPLKQFLFTSSAAVYGNLEELPKKETSRVDPLSPYAIDKYATERYALAYGRLYNLPTVCVRFFNVYGPRQNPNSPYSGVLSILTDCLINDKEFTLYGDGKQTRDFVYVDDVIQAIGLITKFGKNHEVYNIANGNETSLSNLINIYENVSGKRLEMRLKSERAGDVKRSLANINKILRLGYIEKWTLEKGLARYWKGVKDATSRN